MKKSIIIFLLAFCLKSIAQIPTPGVTLPFPNLPSANATSLGTYGSYPISYTNGTPNISIPLYEIKSSKLSLPISISYHANGIKVHEQATSVGLGWVLNAGGAITRQINDLPDFDANGYKHKTIPGAVHASPPIGSSPATIDSITDEQRYYYGRLSMVPYGTVFQKYDGQPDDFFYNFGGKSGRFILKNTIDSAISASFKTIPFSPIKIQYAEVITGGGDFFTIQDADGTSYIFGRSVKDNSAATEKSSTETTSTTSYLDPSTQLTDFSYSDTQTGTNVTAWYLTEMISSDKTDTISFKYGSQFNAANTLTYQGKSAHMSHPQIIPSGVGNISGSNSSLSQVTTNNINLSEIDFKNGKVVFEYATRLDRGTYRLSRLRIYQLNGSQFTELKRINMNQSYFSSYTKPSQVQVGTGDTSINKRLRLDGISEEGVNSNGTSTVNPPYTFSYYSYGNTGQVAYLGEYGQDLWGYWNGQNNTDLIIQNPIVSPGANRVPDSAHLIAGTIKTIQYPTGGSTEFQFEPNQTTRSYTTSDSTFNIYNLSTIGVYGSTSTDQTFTASQTITAKLQLSINSGCTSNCLLNQAQVYIYDVTSGGTGTQIAYTGTSGTPTLPSTYTINVNLIANHIYHFYFPLPSGSSGTPRYRLNATLSHAGLVSVATTPHTDIVLTGGLRIKRIINHDVNNAILTTKRYNYKSPYYISGIFTGDFTTVGQGYTFLKYQVPVHGWIANYHPTLLPYQQEYTENFTVSMAGASDGALAYQEVEEYQDDQNGNSLGKTVYDFNLSKDDTTDNFSYVRINNSWRRNQLLEERTYKGSGSTFTLIKDVVNTYADLFPQSQDTTICLTVHRLFSEDDFRPTTGNQPEFGVAQDSQKEYSSTIWGAELWNTNTYHVSLINEIDYRNALTSTITTDYDLNGTNPVSTQTNYFYNNPDHMMVSRTETIKSNQDKAIKRALYVTDYALDACNPANALTSLKATLASLKSSFTAQSLPVNNQWISYVFRRWNIDGSCLAGGSYATCIVANNLTQNDQAIVNLYYQFGAMKTAYYASVRQAVNTYNQNVASYASCYNTQLSAAVDSVKALMLMQQNNEIKPVEVDETWSDHISNIEYMSAVNKAAFKTYGNLSYIGKTLPGFFTGYIPYSTYSSQPNNYLRNDLIYDSFNTSGNLVAYHKIGGPPEAFIWGYHQQYLMAEIKNANNTNTFYDGFEEGDGNGTTGDAHTGHYSHTGSYQPTLGGLTAGSYIVTYWLESSPGNWSLQTLPVTIAGSTYTFNINGTIDDVRFFPSTAQMTTYTYDPLIGMTSSTDAKNETTYYEYDNFQRLMNIKDKDGNIIKHTDYHYQGQ